MKERSGRERKKTGERVKARKERMSAFSAARQCPTTVTDCQTHVSFLGCPPIVISPSLCLSAISTPYDMGARHERRSDVRNERKRERERESEGKIVQIHLFSPIHVVPGLQVVDSPPLFSLFSSSATSMSPLTANQPKMCTICSFLSSANCCTSCMNIQHQQVHCLHRT